MSRCSFLGFFICSLVMRQYKHVCPLYYYYKWWEDGIGGGVGAWFIRRWEWGGRRWVWSYSCCCFFYLCFCLLFSLVLCLFFKWLECDSCCVCCFVYYLISLSLVALTRSYWGIEIVRHVRLFIKSVSDHYSVNFLEKGWVF